MLRSRNFFNGLATTACLFAALGSGEARADSIFVNMTGLKSGILKGEVMQKGREGSSEVTRLQHEIISPRDVASGLPTGKRQHRPLLLSHPFGAMAVQLMTVMATNENLRDVTIRAWGNDGVLHTTIRLTNASVASVSTSTTGQPRALQMQQDVALTYQRIEVTDHLSNVVMTDDFNAMP
jgi:type VI secretion system secreted protein Hcp